MKNLIRKYIFLILPVFALSGCVDRATADAKLARGCEAAAKSYLEDGFEIKEITGRSFDHSTDLGKGYREVTLNTLESDGWYEEDRVYRCIFVENFGLLKMNHNATLYQLRLHDDRIFGKKGDEILGGFKDWLKLTGAVERSMGQ